MTTFPAMFRDYSNNNPASFNAAADKAAGMQAVQWKISEGNTFRDMTAAAAYHEACAAGLPFQGYHYPDAGSGASQADHFMSCLALAGIPWAKVGLMIDRENCSGQIANDFINRIHQVAPGAHFTGYEAAWVTEKFGDSSGMASIPLGWSNYITGSSSPAEMLKGVTPNWFEPFGGHTKYAWRQFTDASVIDGKSADCNVVFDQASWNLIFDSGAILVPIGPAPVIPHAPGVKLVVDGIMGSLTVDAIQARVGAKVDGIFGPASKKALQAYLKVVADGIFGPVSIRALEAHVHAIVDKGTPIWGKDCTSHCQTTLNDGTF